MRFLFYTIYIVLLYSTFACQTQENNTGLAENNPHSSSNIRLTPSPAIDSLDYLDKIMLQSYTYTKGQAMFGVQGIRLGGKEPAFRETARTNKGVHVLINIDNKEQEISNANNFDYHIADGKHKLFAFICRSSFESIKKPDAIIAKEVVIRGGELAQSKNLPMVDIVYNAPKGLYKKEDSPKILLDFVLVNTDIKKGGNSVKVTIDQTNVFEIFTWQAYHIEGLSIGEHTVKLELLDATGLQLAAPISQKFVLTEDPQDS